ncbi:DUF6710 family protein [Mollicutes bacterium LVI A0039]|nr:DUF6710 family protein [Mollicutes bacterium LVI A0039]
MKFLNKKTHLEYEASLNELQNELDYFKVEHQKLKAEKINSQEAEEKYFNKIIDYVTHTSKEDKKHTIIKLRKMFLKTMFLQNLVYEYYMNGNILDDYPNKGNVFHFVFSQSNTYKLERGNVYSMSTEVVMTCPWDDERTKRIFPVIANEGFKTDVGNSTNYYLKELGFIVNQSGNHSITSMGLMESGNAIVEWGKSFDLAELKYKRSYLNYKVMYNSKEYDLEVNNIFEAIVLELSMILDKLENEIECEKRALRKRAPIIPISGRDLSLIMELLKEHARKKGECLVPVDNCLIANYKYLGLEISNNLLKSTFLNEQSLVEIYLKIDDYYVVDGMNSLINSLEKFHYQYETTFSLQRVGKEIVIQSNSIAIVRE